ncbi:hypothetical protein Glove_682g57 [Diversispora epigaea]|uniref:Uncharacterized protein n=1 Tax=Diversispora epigaea TaxID=1348612 RepID=A0A397G2L8_9GLOM|nr:hypothetical protein Glove_682g57 [Diversispora epigaea]
MIKGINNNNKIFWQISTGREKQEGEREREAGGREGEREREREAGERSRREKRGRRRQRSVLGLIHDHNKLIQLYL